MGIPGLKRLFRLLYIDRRSWAAFIKGEGMTESECVRPPIFAGIGWLSTSDQVPQTAQPDFFTRQERFAKSYADGPAPIAGAIAYIVQDRRRCHRPTFDELRPIASQRLHLGVDVGADVNDKGGSG